MQFMLVQTWLVTSIILECIYRTKSPTNESTVNPNITDAVVPKNNLNTKPTGKTNAMIKNVRPVFSQEGWFELETRQTYWKDNE